MFLPAIRLTRKRKSLTIDMRPVARCCSQTLTEGEIVNSER